MRRDWILCDLRPGAASCFTKSGALASTVRKRMEPCSPWSSRVASISDCLDALWCGDLFLSSRQTSALGTLLEGL